MEVKSKKVKVVMLPTNDKQINIPILSPSGHLAFLQSNNDGIRKGWYRLDEFHKKAKFADNGSENWQPQHLYFISDEEIKEGDWIYNSVYNKIFQVIVVEDLNIYCKGDIKLINNLTNYKIIATTDDSIKIPIMYENGNIIYEPLSKPSQAFIEKYVKLDGIDEVLVELKWDKHLAKTETINSINCYKLKVNSHNEITIHPVKNNWTKNNWTKKELQEEINVLILNNEDDFDRGKGKYILKEWIDNL